VALDAIIIHHSTNQYSFTHAYVLGYSQSALYCSDVKSSRPKWSRGQNFASASASKLWSRSRPRPRGFGLGMASISLSYYV